MADAFLARLAADPEWSRALARAMVPPGAVVPSRPGERGRP